MPAANVVSTVVSVLLLAILLILLGLIMWRSRKIGQLAPLHERDWFKDVFREGLEIIRRCPWILIIPLIAKILQFVETFPSVWTAIQRKSHSSPRTAFWGLGVILDLLRDLPRNFISAVGDLNTAVFSSFQSGIVALIILLGITLLLLRSGIAPERVSGTEPNTMKRRVLGVILGLASLGTYLVMLIWGNRFPLAENTAVLVFYMTTATFLYTFLYLFAVTFAAGTLLLLMIAASDGQELSPIKAFARAEAYFRPLFLFGLITVGLAHLSILPATIGPTLYFDTFPGGGGRFLGQLTDEVRHIIFAMLAFIPVIIVKERSPISSAFAQSIALWARNAKNVAMFVCISALILMVPMFLKSNLGYFFYIWGWPRHIAWHIASSIIAAIGVLVMSSMVVFYKKIREVEGEMPESRE